VKGILKLKRNIVSITKMAVTAEAVVFHHLQANCSAKIVEKFCKEMNFSPPEKKVDENADIVTLDEIVKCLENSSAKQEPEVAKKKRKAISDSDSDEEETFTPKRAKIDLSTIECRKCHKNGHMSRECPLSQLQKETDYVPDESDVECHNCKKTGHYSRNCPEKLAGMSCYNCGKTGHMSRACPDKASGMKCYNCKESGHLSRDCKVEGGANSKMLCYNCQETGHMARDCKQPSKPRPEFKGGGVNRKSFEPRGSGKKPFISGYSGTGTNAQPLGEKKKKEDSPSE